MNDFPRLETDPGFCRVYYWCTKEGTGPLYCWQDEGAQGWRFYRCSKDGEPSHEVHGFKNIDGAPSFLRPDPVQKLCRDLAAFLDSDAFAAWWAKDT